MFSHCKFIKYIDLYAYCNRYIVYKGNAESLFYNRIGKTSLLIGNRKKVSLLLSFPLWLTKESSPAGFLLPDFLFTFEFSAIHPAAYDILQAF